MKKKVLISVLVGGICIGSLQLAPVFADESLDQEVTSDTSPNTKVNLRGDRVPSLNNEQIKQILDEYDVTLEEKDTETVQAELRNSMILEKAKELGVSLDGKSKEEIEVALKEAHGNDTQTENKEKSLNINDLRISVGDRDSSLINKAKEYGIDVESKDTESIQQEILHKLLEQKARELGISTDGKDMDTMMEQLKAAYEKGNK